MGEPLLEKKGGMAAAFRRSGTPARELPPKEQLLQLGRSAASIHSQLRVCPVLALRHVDPDVFAYFQKETPSRNIFLQAAAIALLPFIFAYTAMPYECVEKSERLNNTETVILERVGCQMEDWMRSSSSIKFGVGLVCLAFLMAIINFYTAEMLMKWSERTGSSNAYFFAWLHSVLVFKGVENSIVREKMPGVCYNSKDILRLPGVRIPVSSSAMVVMSMEVLIFEFLILALYENVASVAVVGFAFYNIYCMLIGSMIGASAQNVAIIDAELYKWRAEGHSDDGLLTRIARQPWSLSLTVAELEAVAELDPNEHVPAFFIMVASIYIIDHNVIVNLIDGKLSYLKEGGRTVNTRHFE